jgi:hypothetical protein
MEKMDESRVGDEFERIKLRQKLKSAHAMIKQYDEGLAFRRQRVQDIVYELGRNCAAH